MLINLVFVLLLGCPKPPPPEPPPPPPPPVEQVKPEEKAAVEEMVQNFSKVHFEFDSSELSGGSSDALRANAGIMQKFTGIRVEIQGHADERGTTEYNLALGQKRATSVRDTLVGMGVADARLKIVSYGEEKPAVSGHSETAWSANRRAEFRVIAGEGPVQGTVP